MNATKTLLAATLALAGACTSGLAFAGDRHAGVTVRIDAPLPLPLLPGLGLLLPHVQHVSRPPAPAWRDRDRDGIPDAFDRYDNRLYPTAWRVDRDRDGIPDYRDRYDNRRGGPAWRGGPDRDGHRHDRRHDDDRGHGDRRHNGR
jgi:hypothetical protein